MNINFIEFGVLRAYALHHHSDEQGVAAQLDCSTEAVAQTRAALEARGLLSDGHITARGLTALMPYRVWNAVVLTAGLSTRFAPVSYELPKALLKVRGEVLIERQIEQLLAAGVSDIILVVGYKKELFYYLQDKYPIQIVENADYASQNDGGTLAKVSELINGSYVCSSADYYEENPFHRYEWSSFVTAAPSNKASGWNVTWDDDYRLTSAVRNESVIEQPPLPATKSLATRSSTAPTARPCVRFYWAAQRASVAPFATWCSQTKMPLTCKCDPSPRRPSMNLRPSISFSGSTPTS